MTPEQHILLVGDDDIDAMTVRRTLKQLGAPNPRDRASDGERALAILRNPANPRPGLILLDINMPRMNGIESVAEIKQDRMLRLIPVVVLTTLVEEGDPLVGLDANEKTAATQAAVVGEKILAAVSQPMRLGEHAHSATPSVGVSLFRRREHALDERIQRADVAMHQAKAAGRGTVAFSTP